MKKEAVNNYRRPDIKTIRFSVASSVLLNVSDPTEGGSEGTDIIDPFGNN